MVSAWDVPQNILNEFLAIELKQNEHIKPPEWAIYVKTGVHKERPPYDKDWWYKRTASVLKTIYKLGPIGTAKLRVKYGGKQRRRSAPSRFREGSGKIIRTILQQLEKAGFVKQVEKGLKKGRIITPHGRSFLEKVATKAGKSMGKAVTKEVIKKEAEAEQAKTEQKPATEERKEEKEKVREEKPKKPRKEKPVKKEQ